MFVKNSLALQDAVDRILTIFETLIVNSGGLEEAEKLEQWRNAVRDIRQELESVRSIANRTDNVPHLLIGVDKYIRWTENLGMPGIPFPDWHHALFPPLESIAGHPWLLTVERRYDAGLLVQPPAPATEAEASTSSTTPSRPQSTSTMSTVPRMAPKGSIGHIPTRSTPSGKGKGVDPSEQKGAKVAMAEAVLIPLEDDNGDTSEVVEEDIEMDDIEPARGRSQKRGRPTSKSRQPSRTPRSRSRTAQRVRKSVSSEGEGRSRHSDSPVASSSKYGRAQLADRTTPPPNPQSCQTCINRKVVCIRSSGSGVCDPCRKRKIGCTPVTSRRPSTARTTKVPRKATPKTTPSNPTTPRRRNKSRPPKPAREMTPAEEEDSPSPPPNKKPWLSKGGQAEASSSSVQPRRITLVLRPPTDTRINYPVPPPLRPDSSAYVPLPAPPMPPTSSRSSPVEISPPRPAPFDNTLLSVHQRLDDIIRRQDQMMGRIDEGERQTAEVFRRITAHRCNTDTRARSLCVNLQHPRQLQDNSMQTPQADTDTTGTTSNIIEPQDENVGSPSSKSDSREVMPTRGEPPAIDQGVELLATESSDNGGQADQGEAANIVEATAVAGEAQPVVAAEGGIGGEHHQMTEENSGECPTEGDGATTILASEQQVGDVSAVISEEELGSAGGKLAED
ncbi:hypothetical protein EDD17DRAFT_1754911 [Pisolithus thermaeus]|nr:hypothetical protein EDD17DRAFT_1754911 [Pisolithus thermaeus]